MKARLVHCMHGAVTKNTARACTAQLTLHARQKPCTARACTFIRHGKSSRMHDGTYTRIQPEELERLVMAKMPPHLFSITWKDFD
jgi:hypothetical protein